MPENMIIEITNAPNQNRVGVEINVLPDSDRLSRVNPNPNDNQENQENTTEINGI